MRIAEMDIYIAPKARFKGRPKARLKVSLQSPTYKGRPKSPT